MQRFGEQGKKLIFFGLVSLAIEIVTVIYIAAIWLALFGEYTTKTTIEQHSDKPGVIKTTREIQSGKPLWDTIPFIGVSCGVAYGGLLLAQRQQRRVNTNLREASLQAYLDRVSELLTDK